MTLLEVFKPNFVQSSVYNEGTVNAAPVVMRNPKGSFMNEIYEEVSKDQTERFGEEPSTPR